MIIISVNKHSCSTLSFMKLRVLSSRLLTVNSLEETNIYHHFPNEIIPFINVLIVCLIPSRIFPERKAFNYLKNLGSGNSWHFFFLCDIYFMFHDKPLERIILLFSFFMLEAQRARGRECFIS